MKMKQILIIGAVVLAGGGLLLQQAIADGGPQAVPLTNPPAQTFTVNPSTGQGSVAGTYSGQTSFNPSSNGTYYGMPVASRESQNYGGYGGRGMGERGGGDRGMGGGMGGGE